MNLHSALAEGILKKNRHIEEKIKILVVRNAVILRMNRFFTSE